MSAGLQFDFNYTYSKSIDVGSNAERVNGFESGGFAFNSQVINAFSPDLWRARSDFDTTHQINANWVWDLPFGTGRHWGARRRLRERHIRWMGPQRPVSLDQWIPLLCPCRRRMGHRLRIRRLVGFVRAQAEDRSVYGSERRSERLSESAEHHLRLWCRAQSTAGAATSAPPTRRSRAAQHLPRAWIFGLDRRTFQDLELQRKQVAEVLLGSIQRTNSVRFDAAGSLINQDLVDITGFGKYNTETYQPARDAVLAAVRLLVQRHNRNQGTAKAVPFSWVDESCDTMRMT